MHFDHLTLSSSVFFLIVMMTPKDLIFFIYDGKKKRNVYAMTSPNGAICLTTDPRGYDTNRLNFLPLFDKTVIEIDNRNCSLSKIPLDL